MPSGIHRHKGLSVWTIMRTAAVAIATTMTPGTAAAVKPDNTTAPLTQNAELSMRPQIQVFADGVSAPVLSPTDANTPTQAPMLYVVKNQKSKNWKVTDATKSVIYKGDIKDGKPHGYGKMTDKNGTTFEKGTYQNGLLHGPKGEQINRKTGVIRRGNFAHGKLDGYGEVIEKDGVVSQKGIFKDGLLYEGQGKKAYPDGRVYKGAFKNGLPLGNGTIYLANGRVYKGGVLDGKPHGQGTLKIDKILYKGHFDNGQQFGRLKIKYPSGDKYIGFSRNLVPHGDGVFTLRDGTVYKGNFNKEQLHGQGEITLINGPILQSKFHNGNPIMTDNEAEKHRASSLFSALLAGKSNMRTPRPYSLQILSKYLRDQKNEKLRAAGRKLQAAAKFDFLDNAAAERTALDRLRSEGSVLMPFGFQAHGMLLGLHVTKKGIEARIYNSGTGLTLYHNYTDIAGKPKYQTCKEVLFKGMTLDTPEFKALLPKLVSASVTCTSSKEAYDLFKDAEPQTGSELYQSPQKVDNCEFRSVMAVLFNTFGSKLHNKFKLALVTDILEKYAAEDRQDYIPGSPIREQTLTALTEKQARLLNKIGRQPPSATAGSK